jgi:hypothetical protein
MGGITRLAVQQTGGAGLRMCLCFQSLLLPVLLKLLLGFAEVAQGTKPGISRKPKQHTQPSGFTGEGVRGSN